MRGVTEEEKERPFSRYQLILLQRHYIKLQNYLAAGRTE